MAEAGVAGVGEEAADGSCVVGAMASRRAVAWSSACRKSCAGCELNAEVKTCPSPCATPFTTRANLSSIIS